MCNLNDVQKKIFDFSTGSSRLLIIRGFKSLSPKLTLVCKDLPKLFENSRIY